VSYIETINEMQKQVFDLARKSYRTDKTGYDSDEDANKQSERGLNLWTAAFDIAGAMNNLDIESFKDIAKLLNEMQTEIKTINKGDHSNNPELQQIVQTARTFMNQIIEHPQIRFMQRAMEIDKTINEHSVTIHLLDNLAKLHQQLEIVRKDVITIETRPQKKTFALSGLFSKKNKVADISTLKETDKFKKGNVQQLDRIISDVAAIKDYSDWMEFSQKPGLRVTSGSFQTSWVVSKKLSDINDLIVQTHANLSVVPEQAKVAKVLTDTLKPFLREINKTPVGKVLASPFNEAKLSDDEKEKLLNFQLSKIPPNELNLATFFLDDNKFADFKTRLDQALSNQEAALSVNTEKLFKPRALK
jgi:hypothetical protein